MIAFKFLRADGTGPFSGFAWPLPDGGPGEWVGAEVDPCRTGVHACRPSDLPYWIGARLYAVELGGQITEQADKVVAERARLLRRVEAWDAIRDEWVHWCADRAHELAQGARDLDPHWQEVIEPSREIGDACLLGFIAARIAEEIHGPDAYRAERGRQGEWLSARLGRPGADARAANPG